MKKGFTINTRPVYSAIDEATAEPAQDAAQTQEAPEAQKTQETQEVQKARKKYTEEEAREMREAGTTQGRKGCKMTRINMAFSESVYDYIHTMARIRGESITQFTNHVFQQSMTNNQAVYEQAKGFLKDIK